MARERYFACMRKVEEAELVLPYLSLRNQCQLRSNRPNTLFNGKVSQVRAACQPYHLSPPSATLKSSPMLCITVF